LKSLEVSTFRDTNPTEVLIFEIELKTFNKHSIGSILNITNISGRGVIIAKNKHDKLVEIVRLISSNKVDLKSIEEIFM